MSPTSDVGSLLGSVVNLVGVVQSFGNNWYEASNEWTNFTSQVEDLRKGAENWKKQAITFGLANDNRLTDPLNKAMRLLEEEEERLQKKRGRKGQIFVHKLKGAAFPAQLGQSLKRVTEAFDNIPKSLDEDEQNVARMQERSLDQRLPLDFQTDLRYVRLHNTEKQVREALVRPGGPQVVLLHGQTGRGKSTLARDLALQVESRNEQNSMSLHETYTVASSLATDSDIAGESSNVSELPRAFDRRVVFMKCGREAQLLVLQRELQQKLGWNERGLRKRHGGDESIFEEADSRMDLRKSLVSLLKDQKVLLIFDDVWDRDLLQDLISLCGKNVKCLVTSQDGNLCHHLNVTFEPIPMERVSPADGRKILASHVLGLNTKMKDKEIPANVEGLANSLVEKVDGNLLALACLATAVDSQSLQDERTWEKVEDDFSQLLDEKVTAKIHNVGYPGSFWAAMEISFENLTKEEKKLLILVSLCKRPSVPEEVVEYMYSFLKRRGLSEYFLKAKSQLECRQLIQVERIRVGLIPDEPTQVECRQIERRFWSIHALWKDHIDKKPKTDDILETFRKLFRSEDEDEVAESNCEMKVMRVIMSLYLHDLEFSQKIACIMDVRTDALSVLQERRLVIEPLTSLLICSVNATWNSNLWWASRRVLLHYIEHGQIREDDAIILLRSPKSCMAMVNVLGQFAQKGLTRNAYAGDEVMVTLLELLGDKASWSQPGLISSIGAVCARGIRIRLSDRYGESDSKIVDRIGGSLQNLIDSLSEDGNLCVQVEAAWALGDLALWGLRELRDKICNIEGSLEALIHALTKDTKPDLQRFAARALNFLANLNRYELSEKISNIEGSLEALVHALKKDGSSRLQDTVASVLAKLTTMGGHEFSNRISSTQGSLETLVHSLTKDSDPDLQMRAARALGTLAYEGGRDVSEKISRVPRAVQELIRLVVMANPSVISVKEREKCDFAMRALFLIDPSRVRELPLKSAPAYLGRGYGNMIRGLHKEALRDLDEAWRIQPLRWDDDKKTEVLSYRLIVKARLGDLEGALKDADSLVEIACTDFALQERGIIKCMKGDLSGALTDLDDTLKLDPNNYEALKHRGHVKFLMQDENGALADAKRALEVKPPYVDFTSYGRSCLGVSSVEYLGFQLR